MSLDTQVVTEKRVAKDLRGEAGVQKKELERLKRELLEKDNIASELRQDKKNLFKNISLLEKKLISLVKERKERDETISIKERKIYDLKRKNQELEKFKFVLDYRIRELNRKSEPRDQELALLKERMHDMDAELEKGHQTNQQLLLSIQDLKAKVDALNGELKDTRKNQTAAEQLLSRFRLALADAMEQVHDPRAFKEAIRRVHTKYVVSTTKIDEDLNYMAENLRQKVHVAC